MYQNTFYTIINGGKGEKINSVTFTIKSKSPSGEGGSVPSPTETSTPIQTPEENNLKFVKVISLAGADLLNLRNGDRYKIRVEGPNGRPFSGKKVRFRWILPDQNKIVITADLDANGEVEYNVSHLNPRGEYKVVEVWEVGREELEIPVGAVLRVRDEDISTPTPIPKPSDTPPPTPTQKVTPSQSPSATPVQIGTLQAGTSFQWSGLTGGLIKLPGGRVKYEDFALTIFSTNDQLTQVLINISGPRGVRKSSETVALGKNKTHLWIADQHFPVDRQREHVRVRVLGEDLNFDLHNNFTVTVNSSAPVYVLPPTQFKASGQGSSVDDAAKNGWWGSWSMEVPFAIEDNKFIFPYAIHWHNFDAWAEGWDTLVTIKNKGKEDGLVKIANNAVYNNIQDHNNNCVDIPLQDKELLYNIAKGEERLVRFSDFLGVRSDQSHNSESALIVTVPDVNSWEVSAKVISLPAGQKLCPKELAPTPTPTPSIIPTSIPSITPTPTPTPTDDKGSILGRIVYDSNGNGKFNAGEKFIQTPGSNCQNGFDLSLKINLYKSSTADFISASPNQCNVGGAYYQLTGIQDGIYISDPLPSARTFQVQLPNDWRVTNVTPDNPVVSKNKETHVWVYISPEKFEVISLVSYMKENEQITLGLPRLRRSISKLPDSIITDEIYIPTGIGVEVFPTYIRFPIYQFDSPIPSPERKMIFIGFAKLGIDSNGDYNGQNRFEFQDPETGETVKVYQYIDLENISGIVTIEKEESTLVSQFDVDDSITKIFDKNEQVIAELHFKMVFEEGNQLILVYDKDGNLVAFAERDLLDIYEDGDVDYYFYDHDLEGIIEDIFNDEVPPDLIAIYGSFAQKQKLFGGSLTSIPDGFTGAVVLKDGKIIHFRKGTPLNISQSEFEKVKNQIFAVFAGADVSLNPQAVFINILNASLEVSGNDLPPGTIEVIFSNGIAVYYSPDGKILGASGPYEVLARLGFPNKPKGVPFGAIPTPDGNWAVALEKSDGTSIVNHYDNNGNLLKTVEQRKVGFDVETIIKDYNGNIIGFFILPETVPLGAGILGNPKDPGGFSFSYTDLMWK